MHAMLLGLAALGPLVTPPPDVDARSLLERGSVTRLQRVMDRARRGEPITVAAIGGSITAGASATAPGRRYADRIAAWWRERFPRSAVTLVNAGIGATGSAYAVQRAHRDLLSKKPDFVVVEFAVNDGDTREFAETYEGLLRQILGQPQRPAVVLLFVMNDQGGSAQAWQSRVGRHYRLPMVSYRDALWPEIEAGRMERSEVFADVVHPNDHGHELAARYVTRLLEDVLGSLPPRSAIARVAPAPRPLLTALFDSTRIYEPGEYRPVSHAGWEYDPSARCWRSDQPGSLLEVDVEGRLVFVQFWRVRGNVGRARARVDDGPWVELEAWFDQTWGGYRPTEVVARDLKPGRHRLQVEALPTRHAGSGGNEFKVFEIGTAGR